MKNYSDIKVILLPDREVEIIGTITAEKMSLVREKALVKFKESIEIDGFRRGNAPDTLVAQKVGEMRLLEEAAEIALSEEYPNILDEHKVDALGRPAIQITKIGVGSPLEFKVTTALAPNIKLANYKNIAINNNLLTLGVSKLEVEEKEIEDTIKNIRENIAHQKVHVESGAGDTHNHREITDADLPEVSDEFAKMIGGFKDVAEMREKIKEGIIAEKTLKEKDKKRVAILEKIITESQIDLPKIIIDGEMEKMLAQFKDDIVRAGTTYEEYLKHIKKTEEDLKKEWKDVATKRAKSQVVLNSIAKEENIAPKEEEIKRETEVILTHHKDAERFRVRMFVETFLTNELVFKFLEGQK